MKQECFYFCWQKNIRLP